MWNWNTLWKEEKERANQYLKEFEDGLKGDFLIICKNNSFWTQKICIIARSTYYVPLAHQEPVSVRPRRRRRRRRRRRPAKSTNVQKMDHLKRNQELNNPAEGSHFWSIFGISLRYASWCNLIQLYSYCTWIIKSNQNESLNASRPPPCGCCLVISESSGSFQNGQMVELNEWSS